MLKLANRLIRMLNRMTEAVLYLIMLFALLTGAFFLWESRRNYQAADTGAYTAYRPAEDDMARFQALREINPEVIGWLRIEGMPVDYPLTQTTDNMKYVNTGADGRFAMSGAIFLDYRSSPHFTDFSSIIYGHDMEKRKMFGSLCEYADSSVLEAHPNGHLFFDGKDHGVEFFALVFTDAFDGEVYTLDVGEDAREAYLDTLEKKAVAVRSCEKGPDDRYVLLSTCTEQASNGRYILVGKLKEAENAAGTGQTETPAAAQNKEEKASSFRLNSLPLWLWCLLLAGCLLLNTAVTLPRMRKKAARHSRS